MARQSIQKPIIIYIWQVSNIFKDQQTWPPYMAVCRLLGQTIATPLFLYMVVNLLLSNIFKDHAPSLYGGYMFKADQIPYMANNLLLGNNFNGRFPFLYGKQAVARQQTQSPILFGRREIIPPLIFLIWQVIVDSL